MFGVRSLDSQLAPAAPFSYDLEHAYCLAFQFPHLYGEGHMFPKFPSLGQSLLLDSLSPALSWAGAVAEGGAQGLPLVLP